MTKAHLTPEEDQYAKARRFQSSGDPRRALTEWSKLQELIDRRHPLYVEALHQKAVCCRLTGRMETAHMFFEKALGLAREGEFHDQEVSILRDRSALWLDQCYYQHACDALHQASDLITNYRLDIVQLHITHAYLGRVYGHSRNATMQRKGLGLLRYSSRILRKHPEFNDQYLDIQIWMLEPPTAWRFVYAPRAIVVAIRHRRWRRLTEALALVIGGISLRQRLRRLIH